MRYRIPTYEEQNDLFTTTTTKKEKKTGIVWMHT